MARVIFASQNGMEYFKGISIQKQAPMVGDDENPMLPPAFSIISLHIANPSPVPEDLVVKLGENIFSFHEMNLKV